MELREVGPNDDELIIKSRVQVVVVEDWIAQMEDCGLGGTGGCVGERVGWTSRMRDEGKLDWSHDSRESR